MDVKFLDITYQKILKPLFFLCNPELIHTLSVLFGRFLGSNPLTRGLTSLVYNYEKNSLQKTVDGITYKTPILLSAGFDYNGHLSNILPFIGLGGEEIGSVTAKPCRGNPKPRLRRLPKNKCIAVHKGLKNDGVDAIIKRLQSKKRIDDFVLGISIARTNDECAGDLQNAISDYCYSFKRLNEENVGDYYTINISCPNAHSGEYFLDPEKLDLLLEELSKTKTIGVSYLIKDEKYD